MRVWMTGGTRFVGSNIVHEVVGQGHDIAAAFRGAGLLGSDPAHPDAMPGVPIPYDTTVAVPHTSEFLGRDPTTLRILLGRFRDQYRSGG